MSGESKGGSGELGRMISELRKTRTPGKTLGDVADEIGISAAYLSQIERGQKCPTSAFAKRYAELYGQSRAEQKGIYRNLLREIVLCHYPEARGLFAFGEYPGPHLLGRIRKDMEKTETTPHELSLKTDIPQSDMADILDGLQPISRHQVYMLAKALGQRHTEYLLLANFMPYETMEILVKSPNILKTLAMAAEVAYKNDNPVLADNLPPDVGEDEEEGSSPR